MLGKILGGRYQIIRFLGGGGFGKAFLAEDLHLPGKPECVVKQLNPRLSEPESFHAAKRLFEREAEVLYQLGSHNQIPRLFAHFSEGQEFYLVQEFIQGQVLSKVLKPGKLLSESDVIALLYDILSVLEFVHQQQVIHRDIKPSNLIKRASDGRIVLIDFGAVKQIGIQNADTHPGETSVTISVGSAGYMPNEQLAGKPRLSSDIYATGIIGIQALTGMPSAQLPEDPRTGELLWRDRLMADESLQTINPELADILDVMVRYDFRQRYLSATEALAALKALMTPVPIISTLTPVVGCDSYLVWVDRGDELFQQQRYQEAVLCYDRALQVVADDYLIWFKRAIALEHAHQYEAAVAAYDQVLQLRPHDYLAWSKRGKVLELMQRYEAAIASYSKVIELQPKNYWAWHDRGKVLELLQNYEDAAVAYDRAVQLKPDFTLAIDSRKRLLSNLKQIDELYELQHYDEAIASCDKAIQANPHDALAWMMRGMALENQKQYDGAIASYDQVVHLQPDDHVAWYKRGVLLEALQRFDDALVSYNQVTKLQPDNYWAWHDQGRVLEAMQHYENALASYSRALQLKPDYDSAIAGRHRALTLLKNEPMASAQGK